MPDAEQGVPEGVPDTEQGVPEGVPEARHTLTPRKTGVFRERIRLACCLTGTQAVNAAMAGPAFIAEPYSKLVLISTHTLTPQLTRRYT